MLEAGSRGILTSLGSSGLDTESSSSKILGLFHL